MHSSSWRSPSARWAMLKEGRRQRGRHQIRPLPSAWWGGAALDLAALECQLEWGEEKGWRRIRTLPSVGGKGWRTGRAVPDLAVPLRRWEGAERGRGGLPHAVITPPRCGRCPVTAQVIIDQVARLPHFAIAWTRPCCLQVQRHPCWWHWL